VETPCTYISAKARHQSSLRSLIALKKLGRKAAVPILRNAQLEFITCASDQCPAVIARPVARRPSECSPLAAKCVRHLRLEHSSFSPSGSCPNNSFTAAMAGLLSPLVMVGSWQRVGGVGHRYPAMTARPLQNWQNLPVLYLFLAQHGQMPSCSRTWVHRG
jgi:hypothetical protein